MHCPICASSRCGTRHEPLFGDFATVLRCSSVTANASRWGLSWSNIFPTDLLPGYFGGKLVIQLIKEALLTAGLADLRQLIKDSSDVPHVEFSASIRRLAV
jgi:hypothetical protein